MWNRLRHSLTDIDPRDRLERQQARLVQILLLVLIVVLLIGTLEIARPLDTPFELRSRNLGLNLLELLLIVPSLWFGLALLDDMFDQHPRIYPDAIARLANRGAAAE
jgi:hypothetical protein